MANYLVYVMGLFYVGAGFNHFWHPGFYKKMIEGFLPYPMAIIYISGAIEILLGILVCIPETRRLAAFGIILLLLAVFPANINMALNPKDWNFSPLSLYLRLPLQIVLIYWAYLYTR